MSGTQEDEKDYQERMCCQRSLRYMRISVLTFMLCVGFVLWNGDHVVRTRERQVQATLWSVDVNNNTCTFKAYARYDIPTRRTMVAKKPHCGACRKCDYHCYHIWANASWPFKEEEGPVCGGFILLQGQCAKGKRCSDRLCSADVAFGASEDYQTNQTVAAYVRKGASADNPDNYISLTKQSVDLFGEIGLMFCISVGIMGFLCTGCCLMCISDSPARVGVG